MIHITPEKINEMYLRIIVFQLNNKYTVDSR